MDLGSDDTDNDYSDGNGEDEETLSTQSDCGNAVGETFICLAKELEARRLKNLSSRKSFTSHSYEENATSECGVNAFEVDLSGFHSSVYQLPELLDKENDETSVDRILRLREEEDRNAHLNSRLTAPPNEVRKRRKQPATSTVTQTSSVNLVDRLRQRQLDLVEGQIRLNQIQTDNALIAQEEARERLMMAKANRICAELEQKMKQQEFNKSS